MKPPVRALGLTLLCAGLSLSADRTSISSPGIAPSGTGSQYFWKTTPVGNTAQIVTLFCRGCDNSPERPDLPLIAVLRDTLGDNDAENDRLTSVWLLTYAQPTLAQRIFSAVPFFYWRVGGGSAAASARDTAPLLDLTSLQRPMIRTLQRDVLQWLMLDSSTLPIRATSRACRTNQADHLRLHLEEAISYLRDSPPAEDSSGLSPEQLHTLIARLELRKTLLGGFVNEREAARIGIDGGFERERIRSRNWELLRQCAEKTGLRFEALDLAGISGQYAILWFPLGESSEPVSGGLGPIWKLLDIKNPWRDERLKSAAAAPYLREVDEAGNLLPPGMSGVRQIKLLPISVYSLNYPKLPLLMVDFRGKLHIRWHEMTQRSITKSRLE